MPKPQAMRPGASAKDRAMQSSNIKNTSERVKGQGSRLEPHPRDGYITIQQNTWEETQSSNEQADFEVG